jgi:hypothetical protein
MKKAIFVLFCFIFVGASLSAMQETWFSGGFEFGNYLERTPDEGNTYIGSPGFNLNGYMFEDKRNIGVFIHYSFLFPVVTEYDGQFDFIFGVGFRHSFSDRFKLQAGIGFDWAALFADYEQDSKDYSKLAMDMGIGGDIGIKYDITDVVFISAGVSLSAFFFNYTEISLSERLSNNVTMRTQIFDGRVKEYMLLGAKPYISIGYNFYVPQKAVMGKPKL